MQKTPYARIHCMQRFFNLLFPKHAPYIPPYRSSGLAAGSASVCVCVYASDSIQKKKNLNGDALTFIFPSFLSLRLSFPFRSAIIFHSTQIYLHILLCPYTAHAFFMKNFMHKNIYKKFTLFIQIHTNTNTNTHNAITSVSKRFVKMQSACVGFQMKTIAITTTTN